MQGKPIRIQRKRTKGWRMPENTISVCRPGKWGNPFKVDEKFTPNIVVSMYKSYMAIRPGLIMDAIKELKGKNLACFCALNQARLQKFELLSLQLDTLFFPWP